jgi:GNAT superfamily N-acetyltransferase
MSGYRVEPARAEHVVALPAIERAAGRRFLGLGLPDEVLEDATSIEEFAEAQAAGQLWVALADDGDVVGFAFAHEHGGHAHLEELDVHPDHGRRGVGRQLVGAVCDWAARRRLGAVTLTTYRDIPWNAPFYRRLGFRAIPDAELSSELREIVLEETKRGLDPARRVVMRRETD